MADNVRKYQARLDFVRRLLRDRLHQEADSAKVDPVLYDPESPLKYNNYIYCITLSSPIKGDLDPKQPGSEAVPDGTTQLILRLANSDVEGMSPQRRIENQVAMMAMTSDALQSSLEARLVPRVYGWGSCAASASASPSSTKGQGWILQEFMPGEVMYEVFPSMDMAHKRTILSQMARILKGLQDYPLPDTIDGFGGVTFADDSSIVSAGMSTVEGEGPWPSYQASFESRLRVYLREADDNPYIKGWHANGIRKCLEAFVQNLPERFAALEDAEDKCIVHGDFTTNVLFDPLSHRITALLDYDFACVLHPSYEFLQSFADAGGPLQGLLSADADDNGNRSEMETLGQAKLYGFPSPLPKSTSEEVDWQVAKLWEDEMVKANVKRRPSTMKGIEKVADVDTILRAILPWRISSPDVLRLQSEEVVLKWRAEYERQLSGLLRRLGF